MATRSFVPPLPSAHLSPFSASANPPVPGYPWSDLSASPFQNLSSAGTVELSSSFLSLSSRQIGCLP
ncbi:hypothetical protein QR680_016770 [Steinernema hermaphroditum]|uniref:Uncharacterized protein n=1 Tax=Steinernema hermaphroditum TaxID=289476 RepID=A0AA39LN41_9BILA|nr:hypothetical protein QR680_016770 [Steinernema hermaphroditum]